MVTPLCFRNQNYDLSCTTNAFALRCAGPISSKSEAWSLSIPSLPSLRVSHTVTRLSLSPVRLLRWRLSKTDSLDRKIHDSVGPESSSVSKGFLSTICWNQGSCQRFAVLQ